MAASTKPVIFISYAHADEPEKPADGETQWLSFVLRYLQPAVKDGIFDVWVDRQMTGGADWEPEIEAKLRDCDIFILLVSAHSMASDYIIDKEIAIIRERQARNEPVHFYPLAADADARRPDCKRSRTRICARATGSRSRHAPPAMIACSTWRTRPTKSPNWPNASSGKRPPRSRPCRRCPGPPTSTSPACRRPPTSASSAATPNSSASTRPGPIRTVNILSLVAEGGAGKSALVNEWLRRMQADNYRGAEAVLGWSFYSQGSKERATSAEPFLNWALGQARHQNRNHQRDARRARRSRRPWRRAACCSCSTAPSRCSMASGPSRAN